MFGVEVGKRYFTSSSVIWNLFPGKSGRKKKFKQMMKAAESLPESELRVNRKWKRFDLKFKYLRFYDLKESLLEAVSALC